MSASASFPALGTTATVVVGDAAALPEARRLLELELDHLDRACSRFRDDSELAHANARAGESVHVTALFAEALRVALAAAEETGGLVSPALGRPLRAVGYDRTFELVRARGAFAVRLVEPRPDAWRAIRLDVERREVVVPEGVELDLGATAKALSADRAAAAIAAATGSATRVSLGGDVAVAGGGTWPVRVADDHRAPLDAPGPAIALSGGGLATSSTTVRTWRTDAGVAHHILDPRTARPAESPWRTVTVAAGSCVDANVASTAALLARDAAPAWLAERGVHARLVARGGGVTLVGAWPRDAIAA